MTGVILVVDDVPANVKLLEAKLTNEYYDVVTAKDGFEAIEQTKTHKPDLILLDVMMPGMDGFETCRKIKEDPNVSHIPVVMVTALSEKSDRLQGLEAGADDFITKPINDTALFARVKSLIRIKVLIDELRLRDQSGAQMGILNDILQGGLDVSGSSIYIVDDDAVQSKRIKEALEKEHVVSVFQDHEQALAQAKTELPDLIIISTMLASIDGLRLATQFKAVEDLRHVPIITLVDEDDTQIMLKALDLGVNDYLVTPVDSSEMAARVRTQLRRKKYQDALKSNYKESMSMAITDGLTGLYNRHYLDTHLKNLTESSLQNGKNMSVVIMDMDHFKSVNDTYGHDVGDEVLKQLAKIIIDSTRSADLAARYGGEEFVILMPETDFPNSFEVAERIRATIENTPFIVSHEVGQLQKTVSIGVSFLNLQGDTPEAMLKRADTALYEAKNSGRNQVLPKSDFIATQPPEAPAAEPPQQPMAPQPPMAPPPEASHVPTQPAQPNQPQYAPPPQQPMAPPPPGYYQQPQPPQPPAMPQYQPPAEHYQQSAPMQQQGMPAVQHSYQAAAQPAPQPHYPQEYPQAPAQEDAPVMPASRVPPVEGFDPNLMQKMNEVKQTGASPNALQLDDRQKQALNELKPLRPQSGPAGGQKSNSPIDDEPEGTF